MTNLVPMSPGPLAPLKLLPRKAPSLVFIDLETTGLNPLRSDIIEVAALKVNEATLEVIDMVETRVRPPPNTVVEPEAAELNGYDIDYWMDAPSMERVLPSLREFLDGCRIAGHNPAFDWTFLRATFYRLGEQCPEVDSHLLDTASLAWPLLRRGLVPSLSLRELCNHFGIPNDSAHHALADVVRTYQVFLRLIGESPKVVLQ